MFTSWITSYLVPCLVTSLLLGMVVQVLDRYFGVPFYRWYFNRGSAEDVQMPQTVELGLFHNQSLKRRHNRALILSTLQSMMTIFAAKLSFTETLLEIVIALPLEAWAFLPGLWLGNKLFTVLRRQDQIFDAIDHRQEYAAGLMERAKTAAQGLWDAVRPKNAPPAPSPATPAPVTEEPAPPQRDARAALKQSIDKFGSRGAQ